MSNQEHTCATCPAFDPIGDDEGSGNCHLHAPKPYRGEIDMDAWWPRIPGDTWCMKHPKLAHLMEPTK